MANFLTRKTIRFVAIVGGGIAIALLFWLAQNVLGVALPGTDTSPIEVRLIVAPTIANWVSPAADRFNAEGRRVNRRPITIRVTVQDGVGVYSALNAASLHPAPTAWIAEGTFTLDLANWAARQAGGKDAFAAEGTLAQSLLMWGGFADRIRALDARSGELSWNAVHEAAVAAAGWSSLGGRPEWGFFKLVIPDPRKSSEGLAALLSAAAEFHGTTDLSVADINDVRFQQWAQSLVSAVPNFANLGLEPGKALALRGPSAGDAGLLLESDWLSAAEGLSKWQPPVLRYAPSAVKFDYLFAVWVGDAGGAAGADPSRQEVEQQAARSFRDYLLDEAQQRKAEEFGLRPASGGAASGDRSLFARWSSLDIQAAPPSTQSVRASADAIAAALRWVDRAAGR